MLPLSYFKEMPISRHIQSTSGLVTYYCMMMGTRDLAPRHNCFLMLMDSVGQESSQATRGDGLSLFHVVWTS